LFSKRRRIIPPNPQPFYRLAEMEGQPKLSKCKNENRFRFSFFTWYM